MKLIDADAFRREIDKHYPFTKGEQSKHGIADMAKSALLEVLHNMPTIEERKKGEWIEDADTFYKAVNEKGGGVNEDTPYFTEDDVACSECLMLFNVLENRTDIFSFCPNCGADMRGEHDETD